MGKAEDNKVLDSLIDNLKVDIEKDSMRFNPQKYYELVDKYGRTKKLDEIINEFEGSKVNTSSVFQKIDVNAGIVCDEFLFHSLKDSANFKYIPYSEDIKVDESLDFLLIATSWKGIDNSWEYLANPNGNKREKLISLLEKYNNKGIPTVFYSKEDPVNYDKFFTIAKHCEYIFTSAKEIVERYIQDTGNTKVSCLEFGINPFYHNPIGKTLSSEKLNKEVIFAGSWMNKYPIRNKEASEMFDGVIRSDFSLNIVDRNYSRKLKSYQYPPQYVDYISKTIGHNRLMDLHKATNWGLNLNSVKYSDTMFANRIYELQATGNILISNYSVGVNNKFPNVFIVNDYHDVKQILNGYSQSEQIEFIAKGIQEVMLNHTMFHRMGLILNKIGIKYEIEKPKVLVIGNGENSFASFERQMLENIYYVNAHDVQNSKVDLYDYDFISYFDNSITYEEYYLNNLLAAFVYTDADVVYMNNDEYKFSLSEKFNKYMSMQKLYKFKNIENRKVFNIPQTEIGVLEKSQLADNEKELSVIIPIHNNGKYLEEKCFRSLKRSSIFSKMDIILIDDGSTEDVTLKIINRIRRRYPDVKYYRFPEGSGSASRPRNYGIKMVETEYLTFLDPDNEASGDGYSILLEELRKDKELDIVLGNVMKEDYIKKSSLNYTYYIKKFNGDYVITDPKNFLIEAGLRAHSIQALIVRTSIVKENNLYMIEGAAGQDTMFFQELMLHSKKVKGVDLLIHMYYAAVSGSVTTTLDKNFFKKYLKLEKQRAPFLKENGLYDTYMTERFPFYFKNWYLNRIAKINPMQREEAVKILKEIYEIYKEDYNENDIELNKMLNSLFGYSYSDKQNLDRG